MSAPRKRVCNFTSKSVAQLANARDAELLSARQCREGGWACTPILKEMGGGVDQESRGSEESCACSSLERACRGPISDVARASRGRLEASFARENGKTCRRRRIPGADASRGGRLASRRAAVRVVSPAEDRLRVMSAAGGGARTCWPWFPTGVKTRSPPGRRPTGHARWACWRDAAPGREPRPERAGGRRQGRPTAREGAGSGRDGDARPGVCGADRARRLRRGARAVRWRELD